MMKFIIVLLLFSSQAFAGNWVLGSVYKSPTNIYNNKADCDATIVGNDVCVDIPIEGNLRTKFENGSVVADPTGIADEAAKEAEATAREAKVVQIRDDLIVCAKTWPSLTTAQRLICARKNIALSVYTSLAAGEL